MVSLVHSDMAQMVCPKLSYGQLSFCADFQDRLRDAVKLFLVQAHILAVELGNVRAVVPANPG